MAARSVHVSRNGAQVPELFMLCSLTNPIIDDRVLDPNAADASRDVHVKDV